MYDRTLWTAPRLRHWCALMLLAGAASIASAQWAWRDENGVTVYSDQPPPGTVRPSDVLKQPESSPANRSPESSNGDGQASPNPAVAPAAPANAPKAPSMAQRELEFRKRMKERDEAEKKLADAQAEAARKADECERARGYLKSLEGEVRMIHTNPDGSPELMNAEQREAETQRTREMIESRCN